MKKKMKYLAVESRNDGGPRFVIRMPNQPKISLAFSKFNETDVQKIYNECMVNGYDAGCSMRVKISANRHLRPFLANLRRDLKEFYIPSNLTMKIDRLMSLTEL